MDDLILVITGDVTDGDGPEPVTFRSVEVYQRNDIMLLVLELTLAGAGFNYFLI